MSTQAVRCTVCGTALESRRRDHAHWSPRRRVRALARGRLAQLYPIVTAVDNLRAWVLGQVERWERGEAARRDIAAGAMGKRGKRGGRRALTMAEITRAEKKRRQAELPLGHLEAASMEIPRLDRNHGLLESYFSATLSAGQSAYAILQKRGDIASRWRATLQTGGPGLMGW